MTNVLVYTAVDQTLADMISTPDHQINEVGTTTALLNKSVRIS